MAGHVKYDDKPHTYVRQTDGFKYVSGTQLIHKYNCDKDWPTIKRKYAKKIGKTVREVTSMWKAENDKSLVKGNKYHDGKELEVCEQEYMEFERGGKTIRLKVFPNVLDENGIKYSRDLSSLEDGVYPELLIYDDEFGIAGQADLVFIYKGTISIYDYKTNKKLDMNAFVRYDQSFDTMKHPITHLDDCNFMHYTLQLNLYAFMLLRHLKGYKLNKMTIEHVLFDEFDEPEWLNLYTLENMQREVESILIHHNENKKAA